MPAAIALGWTPETVLAHAGNMLDLSRDTAAALLRAVAVAAEGEDIEANYRPRRVGVGVGAEIATGMQKEIATILAQRQEADALHARDSGHGHGRGQTAGCPLVKRPSSTSK